MSGFERIERASKELDKQFNLGVSAGDQVIEAFIEWVNSVGIPRVISFTAKCKEIEEYPEKFGILTPEEVRWVLKLSGVAMVRVIGELHQRTIDQLTGGT